MRQSILLTTALLLVSVVSLGAQPAFPGSKKYQIQIEQLNAKIDSLQAIIDEYQAIQQEEIVVPEAEEEVVEYTTELSDSLLGVWYKNTQLNDYSIKEGEILDSVRFTSNVPDSVIIERIKAINSFITVPYNQTVKNYVVLYSEKMPIAMSKVLAKSQYYMPIFEETFARYNIPQELKYMSVIESMLNPVAESRVGARGMWQFMYNMGRSYGLKINSFVDERLDVEKAADAAARYMIDSYKVLGDWILTIASYNCGLGNVNKAIRRAGGHRDFWSVYPFLPRETRGYVPAFVGAMYAMNYYKEYGIMPGEPYIPVQVDTFMIHKNVHFKQISEVVGIPEDMLKELNPQYLHQIVPGSEGECVLKIPYTWTNAFIDVNEDSLYNHRSSELLSDQVIKNIKESGNETRTAYRVKSGDYLGKIATKYHVTVSQLMKWNHLKNSNLRVGQTLYIYHNGAGPVASSSTTSSSTVSSAATKDSSGNIVYTVKSGDSFYSIAKKYPGVSAQDIMDLNKISAKSLRPGMKIKIPRS